MAKPNDLATALTQKDLQFQRVVVSGTYLNDQTMLVGNRFYKDKPGFEVLTPLQIPDQKMLILIDRGWIAKPEGAPLPMITPAVNDREIIGNIKLLNEFQFILGNNILEPNKKPIVMQKIVTKDITALTGQTYYPVMIRLDANAKNGFVRDWIITSVNPERHLGYAVQWFLIAIAFAIACLCFCLEREEGEKNAKS